MDVGFQGSLFAAGGVDPSVAALGGAVRRRVLGDGAWVDLRPGFVEGADVLFDHLRTAVPWKAERRTMYDRVVDVPRLTHVYHEDDPLPHAVLDVARDALTAHYRDELPEGFATAGMCWYRDGSDSVTWHGDTIGRGSTDDTMVAIVSVGAPRPLMLRPRGGGASLRFVVSHGDLLVMGGSCQRTWEHAVPKVRGAGPRISVQFRPSGVF